MHQAARVLPLRPLRSCVRSELALDPPHRHRRTPRLLRLVVAAVSLWGLTGGPASAQPPYRQEVIAGFSTLVVGFDSSPDLVDLDGDGDLDAIVGEKNGSLHYFANLGDATTAVFVELTGTANPLRAFEVLPNSEPDLVDLDGDGDLDAVVAGDLGGLLYYANTGSATVPAFVRRAGTADPFAGLLTGGGNSPELADLDGDGDPDAVVGNPYGSWRYFANTGSATAPAFVERTGTANPFAGLVGDLHRPELVDLDGDSDLDAVVGGGLAPLKYFENTGTSTTPAFFERTGAANPFLGLDVGRESQPVLVDLDDDGDLDAVVGEIYGSLQYFVNTGSASAPAFVEPTGVANPIHGIDVGFRASPAFVDLDGDSDLDSVVGDSYGSLRYFVNTGTTVAPGFVEQTGAANPFGDLGASFTAAPDLADLDGDSDFDAVVGESGGTLRYLENTGTSAVPAFVEDFGAANPFAAITSAFLGRADLVDWDGDGDLDAVVGEQDGLLRYLANTGSSTAAAFEELSGTASPFAGIDVGDNSRPELVDLDGDSDLDAVVGEYHGSLLYFANTGSSTAPAFVALSGSANPLVGIDAGYYSDPDLIDIDGDGDLDLLIGEGGGHVVFFRSLFVETFLFADGFESGDTSAWSAVVP